MKKSHSAIALVLATVLIAASGSPIRADNGKDIAADFETYARRAAAGTVSANSISPVALTVNGMRATGEQLIWGGELIEAPASASARVSLESIGTFSLGAGGALKLVEVRSAAEPPFVSASLLTGSVSVQLGGLASARIDSSAQRFIAGAGANFRVAIIDRQPVLTIFSGEVRAERQTPPQDVNIRIVDDLGRPISSGSQLSVRARSTRQIQVQVTDKNDRPLPDLPVLFSLSNPCLGSIGLAGLGGAVFQKKTDNKGIAAVILTTGATRCVGTILAKVEGTNASVEFQAEVVEKKSFWSTRNSLLVAAAVAGAGIGIGFALANSDDDPIRPIPPPGVRP
jgi:hypothetical protein